MAGQMTLVNNPGASRFQKTVPTAKFIKQQIVSETRKQLDTEAATMLPDAAELSNLLMEQDLHSSDASAMSNQLNQIIGSYMEEYRKNPFYTFTQEGRQQLRAAQTLLSSPQMAQAKQRKIMNDASLSDARDKDILDAIYVKDGRPLVERGGSLQTVTNIQDGDTPITTEQAYKLADQGVISNFEIGMSGQDEVISKIYDAFKNLPSNVTKTIKGSDFGDMSIGLKNNLEQIEAAKQGLFDVGLTAQDWNTLVSVEYGRGAKTIHDAEQKALSGIQNIANSKTENSYTESRSGTGRRGSGSSGGGTGPFKKEASLVTYLRTGAAADFISGNADRFVSINGEVNRPVQSATFSNSSLMNKARENGLATGYLPVSSNSLIRELVDQSLTIDDTDINTEGSLVTSDQKNQVKVYLQEVDSEHAVSVSSLDNVVLNPNGESTTYFIRNAAAANATAQEIAADPERYVDQYIAFDAYAVAKDGVPFIGDMLGNEYTKLLDGGPVNTQSAKDAVKGMADYIRRAQERGALSTTPLISRFPDIVEEGDRWFDTADIYNTKVYVKVGENADVRLSALQGLDRESPASMNTRIDMPNQAEEDFGLSLY